MGKQDETGFTVTPTKASFLVTLIALMGVVWQSVSYVQAQAAANVVQDARLDTNDKAREDFKLEIKNLTGAIVDLKEQVIQLTAVYEAERKTTLPSLKSNDK